MNKQTTGKPTWNFCYAVFLLMVVSLLIGLTGCFRGQPKEKSPIHPILDMDLQPRYISQGEGAFFKDNKAMRDPVYGTVARGQLNANDSLYQGMDASGQPIEENPLPINMVLLQQGQKEYGIYCTPCHSPVGDGRGIMLEYSYVPPTSLHIERLRNAPDGEIYDVITNGLRNMPGYAQQITVEDRWAIVAYVRALQRSQNAQLSDVPEQMRDELK